MNRQVPDPKREEAEYFARLGPEGLAHALRKPYSGDDSAQYLAALTAVHGLLPPPPLRVLELGCGTGWLLLALARGGYECVGVDLSPEAVAAAGAEARRLGLEGHLRYEVGDYETFRGAGRFGAVIFHDALHHAADEVAALRCAREALSPGGCALLIEPGEGHGGTRTSRRAVEEFGVRERDMPPSRILGAARTVGFGRAVVLPHPHDLNRSVYRRAYHGAAGADLRARRWLGILRGLGRLFSQRRGSLVVLWNDA